MYITVYIHRVYIYIMPLKKFQCRYNAVEDKGVEFLYRYTKLGFGGH